MTRASRSTITTAAGLIISAVITALGRHATTGQIHHVATYVTTGLGALLVALARIDHATPAPSGATAPAKKRRARARPRAARPRARSLTIPLFGLDWAWGMLEPAQLRAVKAEFVCRYLSPDPGKNLTAAESVALHAAGIARVVIWESTASRATAGLEAGAADARAALAQARACGLPDRGSWAIYFAVDFEAAGPEIRDYFQGVRQELGAAHTGIYGGIAAVDYILDAGLARYAWQTLAWSDGEWSERAQLRQWSINHTVDGVAVDFDHAITASYGQW